jgi:hypothetical protein
MELLSVSIQSQRVALAITAQIVTDEDGEEHSFKINDV